MKDLFYNKDALHKLVTENWSVQIFWFPFNSISNWEAFEAFMEKEIDCGEWDPKEDEVWVRVINKPDKVGEVLSEKTYKMMDLTSWIQAKGFQLVDGFIRKFPQVAPLFLNTQVIITNSLNMILCSLLLSVLWLLMYSLVAQG